MSSINVINQSAVGNPAWHRDSSVQSLALKPRARIVTANSATLPVVRTTQKWRYNPELNTQLTTAQRAYGFVQKLHNSLSTFQSEVNRQLKQGDIDKSTLSAHSQKVQKIWDERSSATAGSIDNQMNFQLSSKAQQQSTAPGTGIIDPQHWKMDNKIQLHETHKTLSGLIDRIETNSQKIMQTMHDARKLVAQFTGQAESEWAKHFVVEFESRLNQNTGFTELNSTIPALSAIDRRHVAALLSP